MSAAVTTRPPIRTGWEGGDLRPRKPSRDNYRLGMALGLAGVAMLFMALTSAYVVRHGLDPDWRFIRMPRILLLNTAVLLASTGTMELARRRAAGWLTITLMLGLAFLGGQLVVWRQLAAQGVYLSTNPHSAFFYLLSGLHGLHILGGVLALSYAHVARQRQRWVNVTALYWHFMDGLWVYLMLVLFGWR